ncbi:hypothetical protein HUX53_02030, partial [Actinomadura sp. BRA 177]|nr:hypothetical protein [Actinomadura sp. BRA 177]
MTEDNRGPVRAPSEDDGVASGQEPGRQEAAAPPETVTDQEIPPAGDPEDTPEPGAEPGPEPGGEGDRLVAGGFAPPDSLGGPPDTSEDVFSCGAADMGPQEVPLQDVPPRDMPQPPPPLPPAQPPTGHARPRPRPAPPHPPPTP